jgi:hypothetical protein
MSVGIDPGCIRLRIAVADGRVSAVEVASERPAIAQRLRGRAADDAVRLVPLLFSLCGKAQGSAALLALEAARGNERTPHLDPAIQQEALREHLWRWLLDLPVLLGDIALREEFVAAIGWIANGKRDELAALLGGSRIGGLRQRLMAIEDTRYTGPRALPPLTARSSLDPWPQLDAGFAQTPQWQGAAAETGAIARRQDRAELGSGAFAARWLARLEEVRDWAAGKEKVGAGGTASSVRSGAGRGRALVETARGLLMHEITLDAERIADYVIVAPTEWNFHPHGPLAGWLAGRDATDAKTVRRFASHAIAALDPCVRWDCRIDGDQPETPPSA